MGRGINSDIGGITALAELLADHRGALNADLMQRLGCTLAAFPGRYTWRDMVDFLRYLPPDSCLYSELHPNEANWFGTVRLPLLLAHIIDQIAALEYYYLSAHSETHVSKPRPYPRPGVASYDNTRHFGSCVAGVTTNNFMTWWHDDTTGAIHSNASHIA